MRKFRGNQKLLQQEGSLQVADKSKGAGLVQFNGDGWNCICHIVVSFVKTISPIRWIKSEGIIERVLQV